MQSSWLYEPELLRAEVSHCGNRHFFNIFCSCDLDLDPMTFIYELDPYSLEVYQMCKYELPALRLSKVIILQTDKQTDSHDQNYMRRRFAGGQ